MAQKLKKAGLDEIVTYPVVATLVLKDDVRAIKIYDKLGFWYDGLEFEYRFLQLK